MKTKKTLSHVFWGIALVLSFFLIIKPAEVQATHFRGGSLTWTTVGPDSASFVLQGAFRRSGYPGTAGDFMPAVGDVITENIGATPLAFGDGDITAVLKFKVTEIYPADDYLIAIALDPNDSTQTKTSIDHQYAGDGPYTATMASGDRDGSQLNNPNGLYRVATEVEFASGNTPPASSATLVQTITQDPTYTFNFSSVISDPDLYSAQRYRLATGSEAGFGFDQPVGLVIDEETGLISWDSYNIPSGIYSAQVIVLDSNINTGVIMTYIAVDFQFMVVCTNFDDVDGDGISFCDGDCNDNDTAIYPGQTEICDGVDNNCVFGIDDGFDQDGDGITTCEGDCNDALWTYEDLDGDTYGTLLVACGTASVGGDCNDGDAAINPSASDICEDGIDQNCDGSDACPPANDLCGGAIPIGCGESIDGTNDGATSDSLGSCTDALKGVWYSWTGTGGMVTVSTCGGTTNYDTYLAVLSGTCGALSCVNDNDDSFCGSEVSFFSVAGSQYYFVVYGFGSSDGNFTLTLTCPNDSCAGARPIACGDAIDGETTTATDDNAPTCNGVTNTNEGVWYKYTGTGDIVSITTCGGITDYDSKISVYTGGCGGLTCVTANDDNNNLACGVNGLTSTVSFCGSLGTEYLVLVHGFGGEQGNFTLSVECVAPNVPEFVSPSPTCGDTLFIGLTKTKTFTVTVQDADVSDIVNLTVSGLPAGATLVPALPQAGNPVSTTFSWTPMFLADIGDYLVTFTATDDCGHTTTCSYPIKVYTCKAAVNAGADTFSFYGYAPQQTISRTVSPTGGFGGYTYSWSLSRDLMCNVYAANGDESFSGGTCTNNTCPGTGTIPSSDPNPACTGSATITAALMAPATVCVTVTDGGGCTANDCFIINAEDVRCFAGKSGPKKVTVCHATGSTTNPRVTICIDKNAVNNHLKANPLDKLGACPGGAKWDEDEIGLTVESTGDFSFNVYPNPATNILNVEFGSFAEADYQLNMFDNLGRKVLSRDGQAIADINKVTLPLEDLSVGVYYLTLNVGEQLSSVRIAITR